MSQQKRDFQGSCHCSKGPSWRLIQKKVLSNGTSSKAFASPCVAHAPLTWTVMPLLEDLSLLEISCMREPRIDAMVWSLQGALLQCLPVLACQLNKQDWHESRGFWMDVLRIYRICLLLSILGDQGRPAHRPIFHLEPQTAAPAHSLSGQTAHC